MTLVDPTKSHHVTGNISLLFEAQKKQTNDSSRLWYRFTRLKKNDRYFFNELSLPVVSVAAIGLCATKETLVLRLFYFLFFIFGFISRSGFDGKSWKVKKTEKKWSSGWH